MVPLSSERSERVQGRRSPGGGDCRALPITSKYTFLTSILPWTSKRGPCSPTRSRSHCRDERQPRRFLRQQSWGSIRRRSFSVPRSPSNGTQRNITSSRRRNFLPDIDSNGKAESQSQQQLLVFTQTKRGNIGGADYLDVLEFDTGIPGLSSEERKNKWWNNDTRRGKAETINTQGFVYLNDDWLKADWLDRWCHAAHHGSFGLTRARGTTTKQGCDVKNNVVNRQRKPKAESHNPQRHN